MSSASVFLVLTNLVIDVRGGLLEIIGGSFIWELYFNGRVGLRAIYLVTFIVLNILNVLRVISDIYNILCVSNINDVQAIQVLL